MARKRDSRGRYVAASKSRPAARTQIVRAAPVAVVAPARRRRGRRRSSSSGWLWALGAGAGGYAAAKLLQRPNTKAAIEKGDGFLASTVKDYGTGPGFLAAGALTLHFGGAKYAPLAHGLLGAGGVLLGARFAAEKGAAPTGIAGPGAVIDVAGDGSVSVSGPGMADIANMDI